MPPGGNPQINKSTGEGVAQEEIIKGIQVDDGEYLVLTKKGNPDRRCPRARRPSKSKRLWTRALSRLRSFRSHITWRRAGRGTKAYALLRDTLKKTGKVGVARVVISTKQHLAAPRRLRPRRRHAPLLKRCRGAWLEVGDLCIVEYANVVGRADHAARSVLNLSFYKRVQLPRLCAHIRPLDPLAVNPVAHLHAVSELLRHPRRRQARVQA